MQTIITKSFCELSLDELYEVLKLRVDVFVVEQNCPYPELDSVDRETETQHVMIWENSKLCAYARCYRKKDNTFAIGRVVVAVEARGRGFAQKIMDEALSVSKNQQGVTRCYLSAQVYLKGFYASYGFMEVGEEYLEDGIPHQDMSLTVS
ncbi:GNAT family N-acetyltransferase [Pseudoalteromonas xiamenensis]|uniref:GNAT family N-acetyltransferase n=1 Tax=Pseudoalteromonas xiamenensis TaxID=882626 RepID=UPI0027E5BBF3|nr:GNAT family N-acetyltransferase [Pseudoalteromonas xiamenensis]WMN59713.1 GNAT family N-acetyltransferase [Pseudoalteromonas xiamenensis]